MAQLPSAHPVRVYLNQCIGDPDQRRALFAGDIFFFSQLPATRAICDFALEIAREKFDTDTPETAFHHLEVLDFVRRVEATKKRFTNCQESKELLRDFGEQLGIDPAKYYFDPPRIRIVPNYEYLHAGVSYAYAPHRDPWYGGPQYQINFWMPAMAITPDQTMAIYPSYFNRAVRNESNRFNLEHWDNVERPRAVENVTAETRIHPLPLEEMDPRAELRFGGDAGNVMMFSGHHLHATIPNRTQRTRFSVDFRFYHVDDIASNGAGAVKAPENIDSAATSLDYGLGALFKLDTFEPYARAGQPA